MKRGFTLIELLAVIVILAIILVIAIPQILGVIRNSKIGAMESDAKLVLNAIQQQKALDPSFDPTQYNSNLNGLLSLLGISGDNYTSVSFSYNEGVLFITVEGKGKYDGLVACGTYHDMRIADNTCAYSTDIVAPVITLNGNSNIEIEQGVAYTELGATATDDKDSNVSVTTTGTVDINTIGTYTITYRVEDRAGNVATLTRTINVVTPDTTAPVITMNGSNNIELDRGITYTELGAIATDNKDGVVSVTTTGTVDINTVGTYTITYTSTDKKGNIATLTRTVKVMLFNYAGSGYVDRKGVNGPVLATGMTPIKWNGSAWVNTTVNDPDWYDYTNKKWANAKTTDGSMWVWVPRYAYQVATNYHTATSGTINIKFLQGTTNTATDSSTVTTTPTYSGSSQTNYILHPAFDFGGTQITGIWIAKFEASSVEGNANGYVSDATCPTAGDNVTTKTIKILPNLVSWRCITVGNAFTVSRGMETKNTYGWGTTGTGIDTHLMKNIEWGAAAYLSKSIYGKNDVEIWPNTANYYITGCGGDSAIATSYTAGGCQYQYSTATGGEASTTGNIYGIYDMNGGTWEYTSSYIDNASSALNNGTSITGALAKYSDRYAKGTTDSRADNYTAAVNKKGDAVYETSISAATASGTAWFGDYANMPYSTAPWFIRGSRFTAGASAGPYIFYDAVGGDSANIGFRPVIMVETGL